MGFSSRMLGVAAGFVLLVSAGGRTAGAQTLADVRARVQAYERTWNTHDAIGVAAFFTRDADMVVGNGPQVVGRAAIAEWWARYFAAISDDRVGTFEVESLRLLAPGVVLANISSLTAGRDPEDTTLPPRRARGTWILTVQDGQWLIAALRGLPAEGDDRVAPGTDR